MEVEVGMKRSVSLNSYSLLLGSSEPIRIYSTLKGSTKKKKAANPVLHLRFDESGCLLFSKVQTGTSDVQHLHSEIDDCIKQVQLKLHYPDYVVDTFTRSLVEDTWLFGEKYFVDDPLIINFLKTDHGIERDDVLKELVFCIRDLMCVMKENEAILNSIKDDVVVVKTR